jgi:hypothetical protein
MKRNQKKKRKLPEEVPPERIQQIIERWKTSQLNSIPTIATEFQLPETRIHLIINKYLSSKILP